MVAPTTVAMSRSVVRLLDIGRPRLMVSPSNQQREDRSDEEEDAVHDAKRKARLQHGAVLISIDVDSIQAESAGAAADGEEIVSARNVGAVPVGGVAEGVDGADEGADEEEIDERDKVGVVA